MTGKIYFAFAIVFALTAGALELALDRRENQIKELKAAAATGPCGDKLTVVVNQDTVFVAGQKFDLMTASGIYWIPASDGGMDVRKKFPNGDDHFVLHKWPSQKHYSETHDILVPPAPPTK